MWGITLHCWWMETGREELWESLRERKHRSLEYALCDDEADKEEGAHYTDHTYTNKHARTHAFRGEAGVGIF
ncbi:hypothetical protein LZ32DRAFT_602500 [Colletotrichum eremochloae]|nr:hypothetical protein LZ32DRAFT_602500 [Colletotrichum eremochloae]